MGPERREAIYAKVSALLEPPASHIAEAAIWLAALDRAETDDMHVPLARMKEVRTECLRASQSANSLAERRQAILAELGGTFGFHGTQQDYGTPEQADMPTVYEQRVGLPVAVGIVVMDTLRACGLSAAGVRFPGHFLVRSHDQPASVIDPFDHCTELSPADVRALAKRVIAPEAELKPSYFHEVSDRHVLARLLNNVKLRALHNSDLDRASDLLERLHFLCPEDIGVLHEHALVHARLGYFDSALDCVEQCLNMVTEATPADLVATLSRLRRRYLNERDLKH